MQVRRETRGKGVSECGGDTHNTLPIPTRDGTQQQHGWVVWRDRAQQRVHAESTLLVWVKGAEAITSPENAPLLLPLSNLCVLLAVVFVCLCVVGSELPSKDLNGCR
jgi:hypothetical protein